MKKNVSAILCSVICLGGFAAASAQTDSTVEKLQTPAQTVAATNQSVAINRSPSEAEARGYRIGAGDEIEVRVIGDDMFNGVFTVDEDGQIQLPFVKTPTSALCKTDRQLRDDVAELLKNYLREPQVNVRVTQKLSRPPAVVQGEVRAPQQFDMRRNVTLLELYSYTGGTTEQSNGVIKIFHTKPAQCVVSDADNEEIIIDPQSLTTMSVPSETYKVSDLRLGKTESNPIVRPGDIIVFDKASPVYVVGEVRAPQGVYIQERGTTLTELMAMVGGVNPGAKKKDVRIYRLKKGSSDREIISANLNLIREGKQNNLLLQPYDIVEVEKGAPNILEIVKGIAIGGVTNTATNIPLRVLY